jgi:hypothetical protein
MLLFTPHPVLPTTLSLRERDRTKSGSKTCYYFLPGARMAR